MVHKRLFVHPLSRNDYLRVVVNLLINTSPLRTAQLLCICCLCSWLTGHFCVLSHRSATNRKRQGCRFNIKRQTVCLSHECLYYDCVRLSCFCRSWLRGAVKFKMDHFPLVKCKIFKHAAQTNLIISSFNKHVFWNLQDRLKASAEIEKSLPLHISTFELEYFTYFLFQYFYNSHVEPKPCELLQMFCILPV